VAQVSLAVCRGSKASLSQQAYNRIREAILKGELPLGSLLSRRKLGVDLGMSFLPITEALERLEADGLVESKPRVGTRVRIPSVQTIREVCIVREALESMSARLFAERASPRERQDLRSAARRLDEMFRRSVKGGMDAEFRFLLHKHHFNFHMQIAECTRCGALQRVIETNQVLVFNWLYDVAAQHRRMPRQSHRELAEVLCAQDPLAADAAMRQHIRLGVEEVLRQIQPRLVEEWRQRNGHFLRLS
jgi:DNA-binding GntR family transcriptional regulator